MKPFPVPSGSYADDARSFTSQDIVNYLPVNAEMAGTRSPLMARQVPGAVEFSDGDNVRQRGGHVVEGRLYFVADTTLYQQLPSGGRTALGTIPGSGRVSMAHNQIAGGNELLIANGSSGYIWNTVTSTLTRITDNAFPGAIRVVFIGQMFVGLEPQRRYAFNSQIADGINWDGTETFQGESNPDRIVSIAECNGELVLLNETSIDHFDHTGVVNALFQNKKIPIDRGCASTHAVDTLDQALFFIGDDGSAYEKRGYQLRRITTHAIEQAWARCDLSKAFSFTWEDRGHKVWYVTFPDGHTWGYDVATQKWHRRQSKGMDRWRLAWLVKWRGEWYGGEYNSGRIFRLDWDYALEGADELTREGQTGVLHNNGEWQPLAAIRLHFEAFGGESVYSAGVNLSIAGDLADGNVGEVVDYDYTATGSATPLTFSVLGTLPDGLSMNAAGNVTGTFTASGSFSWTVKVTDANGDTATLVDNCVVSVLALEITGSLPDTADNVSYSQRLSIVGGVPPYANATISAGALPTTGAVAIDGDELVFTWDAGQTPDVYTFTVRVEDAEGTAATSAQEVELFQTYVMYVGHQHTAAAAVSTVDPDTLTVTGTLAAGSGLKYPCLTDDGLTLVGMGQLYPTKVLISTGVATTMTGASGQFFAVVNDTHCFALKFSPSALHKILLSDGSLVTTYTPSTECAGSMAWNADRTKLYLSRYTGKGFTTLTIATGTLTNYTAGNNSGRGIAVRATDEHVFNAGAVTSTPTYGIRHYSPTGTALGHLALGQEVHNPAINPAETEVWVPNYENATGKVYVLDITADTPVLVATITVGAKPNWVSFSPDGLVAYVTNGQGDSMSVIDTATYTVTDTVALNDAPQGAVPLAS